MDLRCQRHDRPNRAVPPPAALKGDNQKCGGARAAGPLVQSQIVNPEFSM